MYEKLIAEQTTTIDALLGLNKELALLNKEFAVQLVAARALAKHWANNHETEVRRARILKERTDMPVARTQAYAQWGKDLAELRACKMLIADLSLRLAQQPEETGFC